MEILIFIAMDFAILVKILLPMELLFVLVKAKILFWAMIVCFLGEFGSRPLIIISFLIAILTNILKGGFVASGSILGAKSVNSGVKFSNSIYAGNPSRLIKENHFWSREDPTDGS
ncbi:hypothetical protein [Campylobacter sp. CCS1377]|uniref:Uncharacterized protein n=1 Tax=Campylobacter sp. CCS1377 TaxID=3158229 RepID=A0AAU7E7Q9_9BACT|nr:hypothetical protein [Campylobacter jejuni]